MSTSAERELAYYEDLYSGFAQQHFAKPAVAAFRRYLAGRILARTKALARTEPPGRTGVYSAWDAASGIQNC